MHKWMIVPILAAVFAWTPTFADTATLDPSQDNTLYEDSLGLLSNGAGSGIFVGLTLTNLIRRALIQYDLSSIPAGSVINSVQIDVAMDMSIAGTTTVTVHEVLASWGEAGSVAGGQQGGGGPALDGDATWLERFFNGDDWINQGGDFDPTPVTQADITFTDFYTFPSSPEFVALVQGWLDGSVTNNGIILVGDETSAPPTAKRFGSRESTTPENRPRLVVDFTPPFTAPEFRRGNCNDDGAFNIADAVFALNFLFVPGSPFPTCDDACDVNDDGSVNIGDAVFALNNLFVVGSPPPPAPGPNTCGVDPTDDMLDCVTATSCP